MRTRVNCTPVGNKKAATRMLRLAGGPQKVLEEVGKALENQEPKWAIHLLTLLKDSESVATQEVDLLTAKALRAIAMSLENTNGRAYLLASANQLSGDYTTPELPNLSNNFMDVFHWIPSCAGWRIVCNPKKRLTFTKR